MRFCAYFAERPRRAGAARAEVERAVVVGDGAALVLVDTVAERPVTCVRRAVKTVVA